MKPQVSSITCKSALSLSGLSGFEYALNPYRGCSHACSYCYAPSIIREEREWGTFVEIKENAPSVLASELRNFKRAGKSASVGIGTVTDPYQPIEEKTNLTRYCLEQLSRYGCKVVIQTKSSLIERDIDIISKMKYAEVGFTVTSMTCRKHFEPGVAEGDVFACARAFADAGVRVFFFIGPSLPLITSKELDEMLDKMRASGAKAIMADRLRLDKSHGTWSVARNLAQAYERTGIKCILDEESCINEFKNVRAKVEAFCRNNGLVFQA